MKKLDYIDYRIISSYLLIHLFIIISYYYQWLDRNYIKEFYFVIGIISTFLVFDVLDRRLKKMKMLTVWLVIGFVQLIFYYTYKDLNDLQAVNGTYIDWLKGVPSALIVSCVLNLINRKIFCDYFIVTTFRLDSNEILKDEDRLLRPTDYLFSIIGFMVIIFVVLI